MNDELAVTDSSAVTKDVAEWKSVVLGAVGMLGLMGFMYGFLNKRYPMCAKNGCKGHGSLVKSVSLVLCSTHEAALDREPTLRILAREKYRADVRTSAFIRAGNAELADGAANRALTVEDDLFEAALVWSKTPDEPEVPADVVTETPAP